MEMIDILEIRSENNLVRTFKLDLDIKAEPGQFGMFWLYGFGEKPMSFSKVKDGLEVTVKKIGPFTEAMFRLKKGDRIGFRGPYGRGWQLPKKESKILVVAGGVGIAPMIPVIQSTKTVVFFGVMSRDHLMFTDVLKNQECIITTDDGSYGQKGFVTSALSNYLKDNSADLILTCGREPMVAKVVEIAKDHKIQCQLSLERYMKCAIGICGQCAIDPKGVRICKEGPVFLADEIGEGEFGVYYRASSGKKEKYGK